MKIYNSLARKKEDLKPVTPGRIGMYVCGPTVYDEPHIGHARSAYIFDVIRRYLEYKKFKVMFVRNVTDVDDKIIDKARKEGARVEGSGYSLIELAKEVSKKYLDSYHRDMALLGIRAPDTEPKATEYIQKMIGFIELLIERGAAYASGGDVYFDIKKAKDYGKLSNQSTDKMEVGARITPGEKKRDALDFALWKSAKEGEPSWPSPWGQGRPGWHIECSAMSSDILGDEFDIHGGGIDLIFPHHENEVAQSEGAGKRFARYWIHNGLLTINSEKMAKSLGNFISIQDFLARYKDPDYMKLFFLSAHYHSPIDYTEEKIEEAKKEKERFVILLDKIDKALSASLPSGGGSGIQLFRKKFEEAMDDDFNTPLALASLFDLVACINKMMHGKESFTQAEFEEMAAAKIMLLELGAIFGLTFARKNLEIKTSENIRLTDEIDVVVIDKAMVEKLIEERRSARLKKDFKRADEIRKQLSDMGIKIEDKKV